MSVYKIKMVSIKITHPEIVSIGGVMFKTPITIEYFSDVIERIKNECIQKNYKFEISTFIIERKLE